MKKIIFFIFVHFLQLATCHAEREIKTVLITGGCGFIGSNFVKHMFEAHPDYRIIVIDALTYAGSLNNIPNNIRQSERFEFINCSINDHQTVDRIMARSDLVVNFAAETDVTRSLADDEAFVESNVNGMRSMLMALVNHSKTVERFIHISTSETYGTALYEPMDEQHPLNPRSPYAGSKASADMLVSGYIYSYDIPVVTVRPFNNYGPNQHVEKVIPRFITAAIKGEPLQIQGNGEQCRDWIHTSDVSRALDAVLHYPNFELLKNQVFNVGSGKAVSVHEIAKLILKHFNIPEDTCQFIADRPGQVQRHIADTTKIKSVLNWAPVVSMEEGLIETIQWYSEHPDFWQNLSIAS